MEIRHCRWRKRRKTKRVEGWGVGDREQERRWKESEERTRERQTQIGERRKRHGGDNGGHGESGALTWPPQP